MLGTRTLSHMLGPPIMHIPHIHVLSRSIMMCLWVLVDHT